MKNTIFALLVIMLMTLCFSCSQPADKLPIGFDRAVELLEVNEDSLAYILEEQTNPANLTGKDKADYWYLLALTHVYQNRSLINDSLINYAVEYYESTHSPYLARAYNLAAEQAYKPGNLDEKVEQLMEKSIKIAEETNDTANLLNSNGRMAIIYLIERESSKAIGKFKRVAEFADIVNQVNANYYIGSVYVHLNEKDSSLFYYDKALAMIREEVPGHFLEKNLLLNYADRLNYFGDSEKAIRTLNGVREKFPDEKFLLPTYAYTWLNLNRLDSGEVYLRKTQDYIQTIPVEDMRYHKLTAVYTLIKSIYNVKRGLPVEVFSFFHYADRFYNSWEHLRQADKERGFRQNKLVREQTRLELEKAGQLKVFLLIIISMLVVTIVIVFIYQRKLLHKERMIQSAKDHLRQYTIKLKENENIINKNQHVISVLTSRIEENTEAQEQLEEVRQIRESNKSLQEQNAMLKNEINKYSMFISDKNSDNKAFEELSYQYLQLQEREKYLTDQLINNNATLRKLRNAPKFIPEEQWHEIINTINIFFNHFTTRMRADYPNLTDEDIRYCCLIKLGLSTSAIAILMSVSPASVTKRKQRIKEKMNRQNEEIVVEESLDGFLWNC